MTPSAPPTPPPDIHAAESHLTQVLSIGEAQPFVIKIILAHLDDPHPDPHVIHTTLSPFLSDPSQVVKSLFSHLNLPLFDDRRRRPRTESEERYRQYRRERRRERRRRKEDYYRSRKRRRRDYDDYSPIPESDRFIRRRRRSTSHDGEQSPPEWSREHSPEDHTHDRSLRGAIRDGLPRSHYRDRSPKGRARHHSPDNHERDGSPNHFPRGHSPNGRERNFSQDRLVRKRSSHRDYPQGDMSRRPWDNPSGSRDAPSPPNTRGPPVSLPQEDGGREGKLRGMPRASSPMRLHLERRQENGSMKRTNVQRDPGSSMDSKAAPKHTNKLRHLRSKVLASLSKPVEDGAAE